MKDEERRRAKKEEEGRRMKKKEEEGGRRKRRNFVGLYTIYKFLKSQSIPIHRIRNQVILSLAFFFVRFENWRRFRRKRRGFYPAVIHRQLFHENVHFVVV
jgi:hypothetical protein